MMIRKYLPPFVMWLVFEVIAVTLWFALDNYILSFQFLVYWHCDCCWIGIIWEEEKICPECSTICCWSVYDCVSGVSLSRKYADRGFWYYLFLGVFEAATIHYVVAKIFGPLLFGRGWCGYACWTAMVLDLLPFKEPSSPRKQWRMIRYFVFGASLVFVSLLFILKVPNKEEIMWRSFIIGNILYYAVGIAIAYKCKDNRAFANIFAQLQFFETDELFFAFSHQSRQEEMYFVRKV